MNKIVDEKIELSKLVDLIYLSDDSATLEVKPDNEKKLICLGFERDLEFIHVQFDTNRTITLFFKNDASRTFSWGEQSQVSQRLQSFREQIIKTVNDKIDERYYF